MRNHPEKRTKSQHYVRQAARQVAAVSFGRGLGDNPAIREKPMSEAVAVGAGEGGAWYPGTSAAVRWWPVHWRQQVM